MDIYVIMLSDQFILHHLPIHPPPIDRSEDMMSTFPDRIIVVKGTVEEMSQAETAISAILYTCMQRDALQNSMVGVVW